MVSISYGSFSEGKEMPGLLMTPLSPEHERATAYKHDSDKITRYQHVLAVLGDEGVFTI